MLCLNWRLGVESKADVMSFTGSRGYEAAEWNRARRLRDGRMLDFQIRPEVRKTQVNYGTFEPRESILIFMRQWYCFCCAKEIERSLGAKLSAILKQ